MSAHGRAVYRALLRAVHARLTRVSGNPLWADAVRAKFRASAGETDPAVAAAGLRRAEDLTVHITAVNEHKDLLVSYGISTDKEGEGRARVADTARRVGLQVRDDAYDGRE